VTQTDSVRMSGWHQLRTNGQGPDTSNVHAYSRMTCKDNRNGHTDRGLDTQSANLHLHLLEPFLSGERGPDLHEVSGAWSRWGALSKTGPSVRRTAC
jgi:hypothetical protein